ELASEPRRLVLFEAVHRGRATLDAPVRAFGPDRRAARARELTKIHEQVVGGTLASLAAALGREIPLLGEFVIVVEGAPPREAASEDTIRRVFAVLRRELPPSRAAALTAELTGATRNAVYRLTQAEPTDGD